MFLYQKGSAESKDPEQPHNEEAKASDVKVSWVYRNSLSLTFLALFALSFAVHAFGGLVEENEHRLERSQPQETIAGFLTGSQFWFQSFQNWQSEFLAVLSIVTLVAILAGAMALAAFGIVPATVAFFGAAALVLLTGTTTRHAHRPFRARLDDQCRYMIAVAAIDPNDAADWLQRRTLLAGCLLSWGIVGATRSPLPNC